MSDEGEDSPPRPKRKIRKVMVLPSASDSDSDDSVIAAGTRRKRLKVVSDAESVSSSGSSVVTGTRRSRKLPRVPDSEADSDSSGWATDVETCTLAQPSKPASGFASDSSEGNSDKCSICLLRFTTQEVGTPQNCEHIFCLDCITEWSKNVNTCPVDRMTFDVIVVRACAGGRVLRTEPVKVEVRRPSVDILVVEDPTVCEICGSTENEETMLLCDGCDLGYHMHCLTPPLSQVPIERWFCPNCDDLLDAIHLSDVEDLLSDMADMEMPMGPRPSALRQPRNVRRSARHLNTEGEPSTSSGQRESSININEPTTSRGVGSNISSRTSSRGTNSRRKTNTSRHTRSKYKRKRNKTVIIEYELQENGKIPVRKTVKRKIKKRRVKRRQPRTAARRALVRNSVRTRLAAQRGAREAACSSPQQLATRRSTAGIPTLSIFGNANQLDYFSEDEHESFEGSFDTALAVRPACNVFSAHRQARRKMVSIPSPTPASSAPDILSSILESQTLLHSKKSVVTITVDGNVNIKLESKERESKKKRSDPKGDDRLDLSKGEEASKKVPSYPGQSRGGGWGGGYRGNYHREHTANNFGRGNFGNESNYGGSYQNRQGQSYMPNDNMRRDDGENAHLADYTRRPNRYPPNDESPFDRNRRQSEQNRANLNPPSNTRVNEPSRYSMGSSWPPYGSRPDPPQHRHSFGGFENPLDMRMGPAPHNVADRNFNTLNAQGTRDEKPQLQGYRPLPEPPTFKFDKLPDVEKSEDEKSDSGLVIDTEKYDPMEPTHDDDSGDNEDQGPEVALSEPTAAGPQTSPPLAITPLPSPPAPPCLGPVDPVHSILAEMDTSAINVPHNVLDSAVRQVLKEHRDLIAPPNIQSHNDRSDNESDGDCPNFSIYSATSVHIANNTSGMNIQTPKLVRRDSMEDLVQEDDDSTPPASSPAPVAAAVDSATTTTTTDTEAAPEKLPKNDSNKHSMETSIKKRSEEEYKEKISKRCPITTNTRNPIKIKLNTPSLIKRQLTLYDEEDDADIENEEVELATKTDDATIKQGNDTRSKREASPPPNLNKAQSEESNQVDQEESSEKDKDTKDSIDEHSPKADSNQVLPELDDGSKEEDIFEDKSANTNTETMTQVSSDLEHKEISDNRPQTEDENDDTSEIEDENLQVPSQSPKQCSGDHNEEGLEKFTESISETEDERSYTPCLDENKSKDTSMETEREKGIEGLDTEMISEDEGNEMFSDHEKPPSDHERPPSVRSKASPERDPPVAIGDGEEGEILDKKKNKPEEGKKKKKKDSKKEGKDKGKKKKGDVGFKKISRSGKERNYRERDKEEKSKKREKRGASEGGERERQKQKRKEKRKDLERYDVRTIVSEKRRKPKDPFGRDISPRVRSRSPSPSLSHSPLPKRSLSRPRRSLSRERRSGSRGRTSALRLRRSPSRGRRSPSAPPRVRRSPSRGRRSPSPVGRMRRTPSRGRSPIFRGRRSLSRPHLSPFRVRRSISPVARVDRASSSPPARRARLSPSPRSPSPRPTSLRRSSSPRRKRRRSPSRGKRAEARRRGSTLRARRRRRSASGSRSPKPKPKKKKRARSERPASRRRSPRKKSPKRRRAKRRSVTPELTPVRAAPPPPEPERTPVAWSSPSVDSRLLSPRTPPPEEMRRERRRRDPERMRHRRLRDSVGPSKEVFTSGDNILVSVSFKDQERLEGEERRERRREKRRRKRRGPTIEAEGAAAKPVAIIDLERSPFRELTPSPKNVIVLSDSEPGEREEAQSATAEAAPGPQAPSEGAGAGTAAAPPPSAPSGTAADEPRGPNTPPEPPDSPDAYDPYEPTRSASASPTEARAPSPARPLMTLEAAQKTNMSADEVIDRRPLSPIEKVMALLQSTRDVSPEPPPGDAASAEAPSETPAGAAAPGTNGVPGATPNAPRILLPEATRAPAPKLFLAKPSPIKSDPIKPMQAVKIGRPQPQRRRESPVVMEGGDSPYSPGSSDFGDLFEPPLGRRDAFDTLFERPARARRSHKRHNSAKVPVRLDTKKGKTQVDVKIDEDNLKILDDLPSSAVEMQVKSKFLKKLNRQERVVEEVKLVLKPHYNKKHVTKDEYKDILRRAVPKICHNKSGEINPSKIQALVEAYVKKYRKKHKLGLA